MPKKHKQTAPHHRPGQRRFDILVTSVKGDVFRARGRYCSGSKPLRIAEGCLVVDKEVLRLAHGDLSVLYEVQDLQGARRHCRCRAGVTILKYPGGDWSYHLEVLRKDDHAVYVESTLTCTEINSYDHSQHRSAGVPQEANGRATVDASQRGQSGKNRSRSRPPRRRVVESAPN